MGPSASVPVVLLNWARVARTCNLQSCTTAQYVFPSSPFPFARPAHSAAYTELTSSCAKPPTHVDRTCNPHLFLQLFVKSSWHVSDVWTSKYSKWELAHLSGDPGTSGQYDEARYHYAIRWVPVQCRTVPGCELGRHGQLRRAYPTCLPFHTKSHGPRSVRPSPGTAAGLPGAPRPGLQLMHTHLPARRVHRLADGSVAPWCLSTRSLTAVWKPSKKTPWTASSCKGLG